MSDAFVVSEPSLDGDATASKPTSWTQGISKEEQGFVETKGWQSPVDMLQSYHHLKWLVGSDTVWMPSADDDLGEISDFWVQLRRPPSPDEYDIPVPPDMSEYSSDMADWFRETAYECNMPLEMARWFHDKYIEKFMAETFGLDT